MESPGRIAFTIGTFEVMWYGILVALGIVCAFIVIYYRAPRHHGISADRTINLVILILVAALIGTRVYYVIFKWDYYGANPAEIFNFRAGGLAIHGGLIFGCLMAAVLARIYKEKFFNIVDLFFVGIPLGQAIGRWGNFFNSEAHGTHTDLPWAIIVNGDTVHPTFLYESIWCLILFVVLWRIDNKRKFVGQTFLLYCILYSAERFIVEGLRTDSLMVSLPGGEFRQAQVLSVTVIIAAAVLYILFYKLQEKKEAIAALLAAEEKGSGQWSVISGQQSGENLESGTEVKDKGKGEDDDKDKNKSESKGKSVRKRKSVSKDESPDKKTEN